MKPEALEKTLAAILFDVTVFNCSIGNRNKLNLKKKLFYYFTRTYRYNKLL